MDYQRIFITGDPHGSFGHLHDQQKQQGMTDRDLLIILGDVGVNCYNDRRDIEAKQSLSSLPGTVLCLHGNHERRPTSADLVWKYEKIAWMGGTAWRERAFPSLIFAEEGERYVLGGHTFRVIGGAYSIDDYYRTLMGQPFYPDEQLDEKEKDRIRRQMARDGWKEDVILTHTCPYDCRPLEKFVPGIEQDGVDTSMEEFLQEIEEKTRYREWYCGHWHVEKTVDRIRFLSHSMIRLRPETWND